MMQTMIQATALTVLTLLLRRVLRGRLSQRTIYLLWLPVLVRLTLPDTWLHIPSPLSLMNPLQSAIQNAPQELKPLIRNLMTGQITVSDTPNLPAAMASIDWQLIGSAVWCVGTTILLLRTIRINRQFRLLLRQTRLPLPYCGKLPVYAVPALPSPCLVQLGGQPGIYIPEMQTHDPELVRHILAHETAHFNQFDHVWELWRIGLTVLFWWNPLVWLAAAYSRQDGELACDEAAVNALGEHECVAYGRSLLRLAESQSPHSNLACTTAMCHNGKSLRERIQQLAHRPKHSKLAVLFTFPVLAFSIAAAFTTASASVSLFPEIYDQSFNDLNAAIAVVEAYIADHPVWQNADIRYDADFNLRWRTDYLDYNSTEKIYSPENVIVLLCDFTAGDGPVLTPGTRYTDYQFILARPSDDAPWSIIDQGY